MRCPSATALLLPALLAGGACLLSAGCGDDSGFKPPESEASITISPDSIAVKPGGEIAFTAEITGVSDQSVHWSVNGVRGGDSSYGTISSEGRYTAPQSAPEDPYVTVSATSVAEPEVRGDASVVVMTVSLTPPDAALGPGEQLDFQAEVLGVEDQAVTWLVNGVQGGSFEYGTIDASGLYTAPDAAPGSGAIAVGATSVADTSLHGSASVTMISVDLSPGASMIPAGHELQLQAAVVGIENAGLTWSVNGVPGGSEDYGTVDAAGLYTAPALVPGQTAFTVRCACTDHPTAYAEVSVTVVRALILTPQTAALGPGEPLQLQVEVAGIEDQSVTWLVNGVPGGSAEYGTIDASGLYKAPDAAPAGGAATVSATSVIDPSTQGEATITVIAVSISPETAMIGAGQDVDFEALVTGLDGADIAWLVEEIEGGNGTVGLVNSRGTYHAPNKVFEPTVFTVTAACAGHLSARADATVTVIEPLAIELENYDSYDDLGGELIHKQSCGAASGGWAVEGFDTVGETLVYQATFDHDGLYAGILTAAATKNVRNQVTITVEGAGPGGEDQSAVFEVVGLGIT
jgi:hypothetical protein